MVRNSYMWLINFRPKMIYPHVADEFEHLSVSGWNILTFEKVIFHPGW